MTFDTLAVATELKQAGFPPEQAEALARAWSHVASSDLATKADLLGVKSDLEQKISGVKSDLEKEIGDLRSDMKTLRWMIGFSLGLLVLIIGKLFVVPH